MRETRNNNPKKTTGKKVLLAGLLTLAAGLISYFGYRFWNANRQHSGHSDKVPESVKQSQGSGKAKANPAKSASAKTKPSAAKPDSTTKPNAGSASQDHSKQQSPSGFRAALIAGAIHAAIQKKDFTAAFNQLKSIRSVNDYSAVSKVFLKTNTAGKPQTLVNGLLATFKTQHQRKALTKAFNAMGLKYEGKKWALSGLDNVDLLITTQSTKVWKDPQNFVLVPANMVLGKQITKRGDFTVFENEKRYFLVESKSVNYYNAKSHE